ncbi:hypothetical protein J6590_041446, partial [Homalodisca vitripennis]
VEEDGHETAADGGRSEAVATPLSGASTSTTSRSHSSTRKRKAATNDDGTTDVMKLVGKKLESLQAEDAFQNMPQHLRMPNTHSSHVGQYHSFSQPMPRNYVPEQLTHPQEYETIGQTPTVSRIIPQEGEQDQQTHASQGLVHSSAANYMSTFQPN